MTANRKYNAILCDIEGTTTSISFVKNVLFPYCANNVESFLKQNIENKGYKDVIDALIQDSERLSQPESAIKKVSNPTDYKTLTENVRQFIQKDLKLTSLKELQGQMWINGYKNEAYKAHVYDDTVRFFERLNSEKIPLFIYSSGSVLAQKLLFEYTEKGDLSKYISNYFDTNFGPKIDLNSYKKIAGHIRVDPSKILFLTDVDKEAYAAKEAGFNVVITVRDGNAPLSEKCKQDFQTIQSFDELKL